MQVLYLVFQYWLSLIQILISLLSPLAGVVHLVVPQVLAQVVAVQVVLVQVVAAQVVAAQVVLAQVVLAQVVLAQVVLAQVVAAQVVAAQVVLAQVVLAQVVAGRWVARQVAAQLVVKNLIADLKSRIAEATVLRGERAAVQRLADLVAQPLPLAFLQEAVLSLVAAVVRLVGLAAAPAVNN